MVVLAAIVVLPLTAAFYRDQFYFYRPDTRREKRTHRERLWKSSLVDSWEYPHTHIVCTHFMSWRTWKIVSHERFLFFFYPSRRLSPRPLTDILKNCWINGIYSYRFTTNHITYVSTITAVYPVIKIFRKTRKLKYRLLHRAAKFSGANYSIAGSFSRTLSMAEKKIIWVVRIFNYSNQTRSSN